VYKILLIKKFKKKPVIEKLGTFNKKKKKLSLNIFRLIFWLAKKNIFICAATDEIFFQTLQIVDYAWKGYTGGKNRFFPDLSQTYQLNNLSSKTAATTTLTVKKTTSVLKFKDRLKGFYDNQKNKKMDWRLVLAQKHKNN
jgi:hypothetical protein